jgi:diguanylate cyclase (GGDEF)-like protein
MRLRRSFAVEARIALWTGLALALAAAAIRVFAGGDTVLVATVVGVLYVALNVGLRRLVRGLRDQVAATQQVALHDGLTNLPNRVLFHDRAAHAIRGAARSGDKLAVMLLDLDRFKEINDTLGHEKGDGFLVEVARRLQLSLRASDTIARLGGDEFGLLVPVLDTGDAQRVANRLLGQLEQPFNVGDLSLRARGSVGIALYPDDGSDTETLLRKADVAMYAGKQVHLPVLYSPEHDHYSPERLLLIGELKRAIEEDELVVHYQPVVDVSHGRVQGLEALVRWQHPERGLISPAQFVVFAEQTGLMELLTEAVLRIALPQCAAWRREGQDVVVAVNVSGRDLGDRGFPARVASLLAEVDLDPEALELEIGEDTLLADPVRTLTVLDNLRDIGVRLAVDDFGAGRTSLHYLRKLRVDALKIDRSFVLDLLGDTDNQAIVRSTIELAHRLGLTVVAEGVETADTLDLLAGYGCDLAQGHLFSRPVPAGQLNLPSLSFGRRHGGLRGL